MTRRRCAGAACILAAVSWGCGDGSPGASTVQVRDSAGVRIVESGAARWRAGEGWRVSAEPTLSLGEGGADAPDFSRIVGVYRLAGGGLAVVDGGTDQVHAFDPGGALVGSWGREGDGPGEFRRMRAAGARGDTVWVYDAGTRRITFVGARSGGGFRVAPLSVGGGGMGAAGWLDDGSLVFVSDMLYTSVPADRPPAGFQRFRASYVKVDPTGEGRDTLLVADGSERVLQYGDNSIEIFRPLFGRSASQAVAGGRLFYGDQATWEIRGYGADGTLQEVIRRTGVDLGLTDAAYQAAVERRVADAPPEARPGLRALYRSQERPAERPAYGVFLPDAEGDLWVQDFSVNGDAPTWSVFDPDGVWLGTVDFPEGFRPAEIGEDEVLGVWKDDLDVEHARVYGLERG